MDEKIDETVKEILSEIGELGHSSSERLEHIDTLVLPRYIGIGICICKYRHFFRYLYLYLYLSENHLLRQIYL